MCDWSLRQSQIEHEHDDEDEHDSPDFGIRVKS